MGIVIAFAVVAGGFVVWMVATGGIDPGNRRDRRMARQERRRAQHGDPGTWRDDA